MNKREDIHDNFFLLQKQKIFFGEKNKTEEVSFFLLETPILIIVIYKT